VIPSLTATLRQSLWSGYMLATVPTERDRLGLLYADVAEAQSCPVCHDHQPFCSRAPWVGGGISIGLECDDT
jgi:hypothetical protein